VHLIHERHDALSEEDHNDLSFTANSNLLKLMLANERQARVDAFEGPVRPSQFNKAGRHTWWGGGDY
jgi:hypothetical protein